MKILYGIQLTGNGHIARSLQLIKELNNCGHDVDIIVSGKGSSLSIENIKFKFDGFTIYYTDGKISLYKTIFKNNLFKFILDSIRFKPLEYDLIISDFEPISVWSGFFHKIKTISLCNQNEILKHNFNILKKLFVKIFTISSFRISYGYSNKELNTYLPLIDKSIIKKSISNNFYLVYLPYLDNNKIYEELSKFSNENWIIYTNSTMISIHDNIKICQINKITFIEDLLACKGVITASGFSTTSEALVLGKKLWSIPIKGQFEQLFNAEELSKLGIFIQNFSYANIKKWLNDYDSIEYIWQDPTYQIIKQIESHGKN
jgi:uncharacterized protein (TIGR00661 family)